MKTQATTFEKLIGSINTSKPMKIETRSYDTPEVRRYLKTKKEVSVKEDINATLQIKYTR